MTSLIQKIILILFLFIHGKMLGQESGISPYFHLAGQINIKSSKLQGYFVYKKIALGGGVTRYRVNREMNSYANAPEDIGRSFFISGGMDFKIQKRISFTMLSGISFTEYQRAENIKVIPGFSLYFITSDPHYDFTLTTYNFIAIHLNTTINFHFSRYVSFQMGLNKEFNPFKCPGKFIIGLKVDLALFD